MKYKVTRISTDSIEVEARSPAHALEEATEWENERRWNEGEFSYKVEVV